MKNCIWLIVTLTGCTNIDSSFIAKNQASLNYIVALAQKQKIHRYCKEDLDNSSLRDELVKLGLDCLWINESYKNSTDSSVVAFDSTVVMLKKGLPNQYIIYNYAAVPRLFKNKEIVGASYEQTRVSDRWYVATQGFD